MFIIATQPAQLLNDRAPGALLRFQNSGLSATVLSEVQRSFETIKLLR